MPSTGSVQVLQFFSTSIGVSPVSFLVAYGIAAGLFRFTSYGVSSWLGAVAACLVLPFLYAPLGFYPLDAAVYLFGALLAVGYRQRRLRKLAEKHAAETSHKTPQQ